MLGERDWHKRLPAIVQACADDWGLRLGEPYNGGKVGLAVRVEGPDGSPGILQVNFPGRGRDRVLGPVG